MDETNRKTEFQEIPSSAKGYYKLATKITFIVFILAIIIVEIFFIIDKSGSDTTLNKEPEMKETAGQYDSANSTEPRTELSIETPVEKRPFCGDGACSIDEYNRKTCNKDCPAELRPHLGNESLCGNGVCEEGETENDCLIDCNFEAYDKKMQSENQTFIDEVYGQPSSAVAATEK